MIAWLLMLTALAAICRKVDLFTSFAQGAKEGAQSAVRVMPNLVLTLAALNMMKSSGALAALCEWLSPVAAALGLPEGALPLFVLRPMSGAASLALLRQTLTMYGADSATGLVASTMMGVGETVIYTCALYLAAAGVKKSRYILPASLLGWIAGCVAAGAFFANAP